jgi:hypothetical protein
MIKQSHFNAIALGLTVKALEKKIIIHYHAARHDKTINLGDEI